MLVDNILRVYERADSESISAGMNWYSDAHQFAASIDNPFRSAGVIAALSPKSGWTNNKNKAAQLYSQDGDGTHIGMRGPVSKAIRIYRGEDALDVLGGDKERAFYVNIVEPDNTWAVTIDRHAYDLAIGQYHNEKERSPLSRKGEYDRFAGAFRSAASSVGIRPSELQAITWVQWRKEHGKDWHG